METTEVSDLHRRCTEALAAYVDQLQKSCGLLNGIETFPISLAGRRAVLDQRRAESGALERYHLARNRLYTAAKWNEF